MLAVLRDLVRHNPEFRIGLVLVLLVLTLAALSFASPYPELDVYVVPPDVPPSSAYWFGTTSRGQDVFWQVCTAIRHTLAFGLTVALVSRVISLGVATISIVAVSTGVLIIDLLYPLLDPRVEAV